MNTKNSIKLRVGDDRDGMQVFKAIIIHPMETGLRKDHRSGKLIPAEYIKDFRVSVDDELIFEILMGENVSKNPFLTFTFTQRLVNGQNLQIQWLDNHNNEISYEFPVQFAQDGRFSATASKPGSEIDVLSYEPLPTCKNKITATH